MHPSLDPHTLIPLVTAAGAVVLAAAIAARDVHHRANQLVIGLLLLTAFWSASEAGWNGAIGRDRALALARWSSVGSMLLGPVAFHLILTLQPELHRRLSHLLPAAYGAGVLAVLVSVATPLVIVDVAPTSRGWAPRLGPAVLFAYLASSAAPAVAAAMWLRIADPRVEGRSRYSPWIELALVIPLVVSTMTHVVLPLMEVDVPRLGGICLVAWGGVTWWSITHFRNPELSPRVFARELLETLPEGVLLLRLDGRIRSANGAMDALAGGTPGELPGRPISELLSADLRAETTAQGERTDFECELTCESLERIPVSLSSVTLRDEQSNPIGSVLVIRDLRELVSLRSRLVTSGRLAAVGQLAAGIAHEINNPIAYVRSNLGLLDEHWEEVGAELGKSSRAPALGSVLGDGNELIRDTVEAVDRVAAIVRDVEGFSQPADVQHDHTDLREVLDTAVRMATPQLRGRARVELHYGTTPAVQCRSHELMQVFLNLIRNAGNAIADHGTIRITTAVVGKQVLVAVEDDGEGIAPQELDRIFDVRSTASRVPVETGLGLAISKQIIERNGGEIRVSSVAGRGAQFHVVLPAAPGDAEAAA